MTLNYCARVALTLCVVGSPLALSAQPLHLEGVTTDFTTDPMQARIVVADIETFVRVQELLADATDTASVLQAEYLDKGTPGLELFIEKYDLSVQRLHKAIRKHPEKYSSLAEMPAAVLAYEDDIREVFADIKRVIPQAVFPPTYFLVGGYRGIGSGSAEGPLITVEKWSIPIEGKTTMLAHEMTHIQQVVAVGYEKYLALFGKEKSLLGLTIREGTAEFFANLIVGDMTQDKAVQYVRDNEQRLWEAFQVDMLGSETGDWMWSKPENPEQPRHVAYVLGAFIVQAYYDRAEDKAQAVTDILSVTDYEAFLEKSGYAEKFEM